MSFDEGERPHRNVRYDGEDTSPTTKRELHGWYSYAIAAEVFAVVGSGAFLPVTLEQLARENGVFFSDKSKPCVEIAAAGSAGNARFLTRADEPGKNEQCVVNFLGSEITTASFSLYTLSAAVLVQAVVLICFSSFADHGPYRKKLLMAFAYTGSIASALFIFVSPSVYFLAPFLAIIGVTSLGSSFTLLNAFLPLLVANSQDSGKETDGSLDYELEALNPESDGVRHNPEKLLRDLELSAKISSKGTGIGYMAAVLEQCLSILMLVVFSKFSISKTSPSFPMRFILFIVGIWWASFSTPTLLWLRPRPGPPLPTQPKRFGQKRGTLLFYIKFSLSSFWATVKRAFKLRQVVTFLVAWFILSDVVATISGTAVLFARTELHMGTIAVAILSIDSIGFGIVGAFAWPRIAARYSLQPKSVILLCVAGLTLIPLYCLTAYIPFIHNAGVGGLQQPWEIYLLGTLHGFAMGGISSYCRSFYGHLIPEGSEAAFYALYAVTDKGSSAVGPALVGWIVDRAGTIRPAFIFLAMLAWMPAPLLYFVDVEKGREDAARLAAARSFERNSEVD